MARVFPEDWALPRLWHLPSIVRGVPQPPFEARPSDRAKFLDLDVLAIRKAKMAAVDEKREFLRVYGIHIGADIREYLEALATGIAKSSGAYVFMSTFHYQLVDMAIPIDRCASRKQKKLTANARSATMRTLSNNASAYDTKLGLISVGEGGIETGIETAPLGRKCLYFTSAQKDRLMKAFCAVSDPYMGPQAGGPRII